MSTGCKSSHNGFLDVSHSNGGLRIAAITALISYNIQRSWKKKIGGTYVLTDSLVDWIIVIKCHVCEATQALRGTILDQIDMINMSKLREILRQDRLVGRFLQSTNKDLAHTNLILTVQRLLHSNVNIPTMQTQQKQTSTT